MLSPLSITLTPFQLKRVESFAAEERELRARHATAMNELAMRRNEGVTMLLAGLVDPNTIANWQFTMEGNVITVTPPVPDATPSPLALVPDETGDKADTAPAG